MSFMTRIYSMAMTGVHHAVLLAQELAGQRQQLQEVLLLPLRPDVITNLRQLLKIIGCVFFSETSSGRMCCWKNCMMGTCAFSLVAPASLCGP